MKKRIGQLAIAALIGLTACGQGSNEQQPQAEQAAAQTAQASTPQQTVKTESDSVTLETPAQTAAGSTFQVTWTGPDAKNDYITIVEKGAAKGKYENYTYTKKGSPLELKALDNPGEYEIRYVDGTSKDILASAPIEVTEVTASLEAPEEIGAGASFEVSWTGPDNDRDYVTVVPEGAAQGKYESYTYTNKGSPLELRASDEPGSYEVRYVMGQSKRILASSPITVKAAQASLDVSGDGMVEAPVEVSWTGPDNDRDYIAIAEVGAPEGKYLSYTYTKQGNPLTVKGPKTPGQYEVRYVMGQSKATLASAPLTIKPLGATLEAPSEAAPGASLEINWTGPNNPQDFIAVAKTDAAFNSYESRALSQAGSPAKLFAPSSPGEYEVRYVMARSRQILASVPITVARPEQ